MACKARMRRADARRRHPAKVIVVTEVSRNGGCVASIFEGKKLSIEDVLQALDRKVQEDTLLIFLYNPYRSVGRHQPHITHKEINSMKNIALKTTDKLHLLTDNNQNKQIRQFLA
jgi:hypothetical protein